MKLSRFRRRPGRRAAVSLVVATATLLLGACNYGFSGGGGFPRSIRTVCIQTFDNQTDHSELTSEIFQAMYQRVPGALGVRPGDCKGGADAVIRGKILRYDDAATNYSANQTTSTTTPPSQEQHQVTVGISVEIVDSRRNVMLWESQGVSGSGTYLERNDRVGRQQAIERLVQAIIDGAQSQW